MHVFGSEILLRMVQQHWPQPSLAAQRDTHDMGHSHSLFIDSSSDVMYLHGAHNPGLVLLSVLVAVLTSGMALQTAHIARSADTVRHRSLAIGSGAIALGGGIWTMHFIGMLAFELPTLVMYSASLTLLSSLPGFAAAWLALRILSRPDVSGWRLMGVGVLVGLGIGAMHYSGMAAMQMVGLRYEPRLFALSLVVSVALATLALWIRFGLNRTSLGPTRRLALGGIVMGLSISGMHYTGMAAARFTGEPGTQQHQIALDPVFVSLALSTFTLTVAVLVTAANGLIRYRDLFRKLSENESRLHAIVDTVVDAVVTIDSRGIVQAFNRSATRIFGWEANEVIGRNVRMLMPEPDRSLHNDYIDNYRSSGQPRIIGSGREVTGQRKDGSLVPIRLAVGQVELRGEPLFVGIMTDITDRHAMEASLREAAEQARQAAEAKSAFLANMSHEIRTPMNAIIGFTELLLKEDLTALQRSHLGTIRQSSRSLLALLNDILDTTKLEKNSLELESIDFSLKELAGHIEASMCLSAQSKGLTLDTDYPDGMPQYFKGDPLRVQQVLANLIGNAIKFTEQGHVSVIFRHEGGQVHVQVRDSGIGMSPEQLQTIFAPFSQADASISRRFGGTGLGTTIARQLVELMGGTIDVESTLGVGSVFHVRLPLLPGSKPGAPAPEVGTASLPPLRILIADDVPQNVELLKLMLEGRGHQTATARDGDEAVEMYMAQSFDLVLMDMHMPRTDGLQATRRIRQYEQARSLPAIPIIALTASVMESDRRSARDAGMSGFATKPLDTPRLLNEMSRVLGHTSAGAYGGRQAAGMVASHRTLIDWTSGVALWGNKARLAQALQTFLAEAAMRHPLPSEDAAEIDWDATLFSLHGLRGAAGNLALPQVTELAAALEESIKLGSRDDVRPRLAELRRLLASAAEELHGSGALAASVPPQQAAPGEDLQAQLRELIAGLERSELPAPALDVVSQHLRAQGQHALHDELHHAIDTFDFHRARLLLSQLQAADPVAAGAAS